MNWDVLIAALVGFTTGNLPDHSPAWAFIKLVFTVVLVVLMIRLARKEVA